MSDVVRPYAEGCAAVIEALGIGFITLLAVYSLVYGGWQLLRGMDRGQLYIEIRHRLGHGILIGLELLVAADIIHTVALELTFERVAVLGIVVVIRTFLSFALEVELTGRWPWQPADEPPG